MEQGLYTSGNLTAADLENWVDNADGSSQSMIPKQLTLMSC